MINAQEVGAGMVLSGPHRNADADHVCTFRLLKIRELGHNLDATFVYFVVRIFATVNLTQDMRSSIKLSKLFD
jgi:hypothetical protein